MRKLRHKAVGSLPEVPELVCGRPGFKPVRLSSRVHAFHHRLRFLFYVLSVGEHRTTPHKKGGFRHLSGPRYCGARGTLSGLLAPHAGEEPPPQPQPRAQETHPVRLWMPLPDTLPGRNFGWLICPSVSRVNSLAKASTPQSPSMLRPSGCPRSMNT